MANTHILITLDYELFGDGSGDVMKTMITPTDHILDILDKHNAKLTIFAELLELWEMKKAMNEGILSLKEYDPCEKIDSQIKRVVSKGHDVQFHMHPQWLDSKYENGKWKLNFDYWRTPMVPGGLGSEDDAKSLVGLFSKGKAYLENLCKPVNQEYICVAYRAGAHCIQPHKDVFMAMEKTGFTVDSTVFPGGYEKSEHSFYDFRNIGTYLPYRPSLDDIGKHESGGKILELPLYAKKISLAQAAIFRNTAKPPNQEYSAGGGKKITAPPGMSWSKRWDFDKLNARGMKSFLKKALAEKSDKTRILVMTGHAKTFNNAHGLDEFLKWTAKQMKKNPGLRFSTLREAVQDYTENEK